MRPRTFGSPQTRYLYSKNREWRDGYTGKPFSLARPDGTRALAPFRQCAVSSAGACEQGGRQIESAGSTAGHEACTTWYN